MYDEIIEIINSYNGVITAKEAKANGISRTMLKKLADSNHIERIDYGLYATDKFLYDEFYIFYLKHKNIIFSYNSALYLQNMTERTPFKMDVTTKRNTNLSAYKDKIYLYRVTDKIFDLGKIKVMTPLGNLVDAYNLERTICDIINNMSNIDLEVANTAIRKCIRDKKLNPDLMFEYAKILKIYEKVKLYIEAML